MRKYPGFFVREVLGIGSGSDEHDGGPYDFSAGRGEYPPGAR